MSNQIIACAQCGGPNPGPGRKYCSRTCFIQYKKLLEKADLETYLTTQSSVAREIIPVVLYRDERHSLIFQSTVKTVYTKGAHCLSS